MTDPRDTATSSLDPFFAGQQIGGQFEVDKALGHNQLGTTYLARKLDNNRAMLLKTLPITGQDADFEAEYDRLRAEVRLVSGVPHKNLAKVYGIGRETSAAFVVMEHVEGLPLAEYLDKRRLRGESLNPKGVFNIIGHICSGLKALHAHCAHGTLTARHVFVTDQGRVKIVNIAYGHTLAATLHARALGPYVDSPFIAPELRDSPSMRSPAADIYALGMLTAEMLSPQPIPGHGEPARQRALAIAADFGPEILALIEASTDLDPNRRPNSAVDFRERLKVIVEAPTLAPLAAAIAEPEKPASTNTVDIGPEPGQELLADDAPTPQPADTEDPFAKAAKILGKTGAISAIQVTEGDKAGTRYLVSIDGLDYGPFSHEQVLEQLRSDQIDEFTSVLDRATQTRMALQDMPVFRQAVLKYIPVRAERQRIENERRAQRVQTAKTAGKWTSYAGIGAGLLLGAVFAVYWFFIRPKPEALPEQTLIADLSEGFKLLPPPKDFDQINVDKDMMAALFSENSAAVRKNIGGIGRRNQGDKATNGGGVNPQDDDLTNTVDFDGEGGGTDHVLTDGEVTRVVVSQFGGLQGCLMPELKRNPGFRGVRVKFFIKPSGTTAGVSVLESAYNSGPVGDCLKNRFRGMQFPAHGGFNKGVIFPLLIQ